MATKELESMIDQDERTPFSIDAIRTVAEEHSFAVLDWGNGDHTIMDAITANMFVKVFDSLKPHLQKLVEAKCAKGSAGLVKTVDIFWGACK